MQDTMKRKYTCDRSITVTRLEDLLQDAAVGLFTFMIQCLISKCLTIKRMHGTIKHHWFESRVLHRMRKSK